MDNNILEYVGKKLYKTNVLKEMKRYVVFRTRCRLHSSVVEDMLAFFSETPEREAMLMGSPSLLEQVTRTFFYKGSKWNERAELVKDNIRILEKHFKPELLQELYAENKHIKLWEDVYQDKPLVMELFFHAGQRKEGTLSVTMIYEGIALYQIMFWLGKDKYGDEAIFIGALQGTPNGSDIIKGLTKAFFGYRTKNLIFYGLRSFAKALGMKKIYAVANEGYYAMSHIRIDRKLKTDFGAFWQECEGTQCDDPRFYVMPVEEYRKSMEELKPSKRAQHRRRFAKMDELQESVAASLAKYKK